MGPFGGVTFGGSVDLWSSLVSFSGDAFKGLPFRSVVVKMSKESPLFSFPAPAIEFILFESDTCLAITTRIYV